jgi:hypothetical protein
MAKFSDGGEENSHVYNEEDYYCHRMWLRNSLLRNMQLLMWQFWRQSWWQLWRQSWWWVCWILIPLSCPSLSLSHRMPTIACSAHSLCQLTLFLFILLYHFDQFNSNTSQAPVFCRKSVVVTHHSLSDLCQKDPLSDRKHQKQLKLSDLKLKFAKCKCVL